MSSGGKALTLNSLLTYFCQLKRMLHVSWLADLKYCYNCCLFVIILTHSTSGSAVNVAEDCNWLLLVPSSHLCINLFFPLCNKIMIIHLISCVLYMYQDLGFREKFVALSPTLLVSLIHWPYIHYHLDFVIYRGT